jgi:hypothetical protein
MFFLSLKSKYPVLFVLLNCFCVSLLIALIHASFSINVFLAILGLTLLLSGGFLEVINKDMFKLQSRLLEINKIEEIGINSRNINTKGNYNENIGRDYIGGDSINKNIKNVTVGGREVTVNPNYILDTFEDFKDILTESINQTSNALDAISEFANQLTEEIRKQPEVKCCFNMDKNVSAEELTKKIFLFLLNGDYDDSNESYPVININSNEIEKFNNANKSVYIESFQNNWNGKYIFSYKNYVVELFQEQNKMWHHKIIRSDKSLLKYSDRRSSNIYFAIGRAIDTIEKEIVLKWKNNLNNSRN